MSTYVFGRYLAGDVDLAGDGKRFDGNARVRIVLDQRVEHGVGDLIGELVGMPFGHRFAREEPPVRHLGALAPGRDVLYLLRRERVDFDAHRGELEPRDLFVDLDRYVVDPFFSSSW